MRAIVHVVDDDPSFRRAVHRLLRACGYEVVLHDSSEHLLAHLPCESERCCVLLDVVIPGMSGTELQDRLAERGFKAPIIFVTGHEDIPMRLQPINGGADEFLTKPVSRIELVTEIERVTAEYWRVTEATQSDAEGLLQQAI